MYLLVLVRVRVIFQQSSIYSISLELLPIYFALCSYNVRIIITPTPMLTFYLILSVGGQGSSIQLPITE